MKSSLSPSREPVIHERANSLAVTLRGMAEMEDGGFNLNLRKPLEKMGILRATRLLYDSGRELGPAGSGTATKSQPGSKYFPWESIHILVI
jgi:hypothetical protein